MGLMLKAVRLYHTTTADERQLEQPVTTAR
jgi:hypothetical protein